MTPLERLEQIAKIRAATKLAYVEALADAKAEGYSNVKIAKSLGISEAAVRMYIIRNEIGK